MTIHGDWTSLNIWIGFTCMAQPAGARAAQLKKNTECTPGCPTFWTGSEARRELENRVNRANLLQHHPPHSPRPLWQIHHKVNINYNECCYDMLNQQETRYEKYACKNVKNTFQVSSIWYNTLSWLICTATYKSFYACYGRIVSPWKFDVLKLAYLPSKLRFLAMVPRQKHPFVEREYVAFVNKISAASPRFWSIFNVYVKDFG